MRELISQAELARRLGVSRQYINDLVHKGLFKLHNGKIDPAEADKRIRQNTSPYDSPNLWQGRAFNPFDKCNCSVDLKNLARALAPYLKDLLEDK